MPDCRYLIDLYGRTIGAGRGTAARGSPLRSTSVCRLMCKLEITPDGTD